jgi:hypothetical protein
VAVLLLSLGLVSLVLAFIAGRYSMKGSGLRAGALVALGMASLVGMVLVLSGNGWSEVRDVMLWPLAVYITAALTGAGLGAGIIYALVAAR